MTTNINNVGNVLSGVIGTGNFAGVITTTNSVAPSGAYTVGTLTFTFEKIGDLVVIKWPDFTFTASSTNTLNFTSAVPAGYIPVGSTYTSPILLIRNNGSNTIAFLNIDTSGNITVFGSTSSGNFTGSTACAFWGGTVSYLDI